MQVIWNYNKYRDGKGTPRGDIFMRVYSQLHFIHLFNYSDGTIATYENNWIVPNTIPECDL